MKLLLILAVLVVRTCGYYLPGVVPTEYSEGSEVKLLVNKLTSVRKQVPYRYYMLPYCRPDKTSPDTKPKMFRDDSMSMNLGGVLAGDSYESSPYELRMNVSTDCRVQCTVQITDSIREQFKRMIDDEYVVHWIVDNLPALSVVSTNLGDDVMNGFFVGERDANGKYFVNNHVDIELHYHEAPPTAVELATGEADPSDGTYLRVVGFQVAPSSLGSMTAPSAEQSKKGECSGVSSSALDLDTAKEITFSYSVQWENSPVRWAARWEPYLSMHGEPLRWSSIANSVLVVACLSVVVGIILTRTLQGDIRRYNDEQDTADSGWKLVYGDVFRKPRHSKMLVVCVGAGLQILFMGVCTLCLAALGFLSPAHRGGFLQAIVVLFNFLGFIAGYAAARLYKMFRGEDWKTTTLLSAFLFPGTVFSVFFSLNLMLWYEESSAAVPFSTLVLLLCLWLLVAAPLVLMGAWRGFKRESIELPCRTNQIPRQIPEQPLWLHPVVVFVCSGFLPFAAAQSELSLIVNSVWQHQLYHVAGVLAVVLVLVLAISAEVAVLVTYVHLAMENYHWWWPAFLSGGGLAFWFAVFSVGYLVKGLAVTSGVGLALYIGYMTLACVVFFLLAGAVTLLASFLFVRHIYGSIKLD